MKIDTDFEFYCYLKKNLPKRFKIEAQPSASYYSEWQYNYIIYKDGQKYKQYEGDFRNIKSGELVEEAILILKKING